MREPLKDKNRLEHMLDAIDTIMRHHLVHGYYQVDSQIVWAVIQNDLRPLREQIEKYLAETDWDQWEKRNINV